jgi:hypothetical protein
MYYIYILIGRSASERLRMSNLVSLTERILVMFCGVGPFLCVLGARVLQKIKEATSKGTPETCINSSNKFLLMFIKFFN